MESLARIRRARRLAVAALLVALLAALTAATAGAQTPARQSTDGLYLVTARSELEPLVINRLHAWTLTIEDRDGNPVTGARIEVTGGMPEHNHGLPTHPRVTRELGNGLYRLEGMRFHMPGRWEITIRVDAAPGADTVVMTLEL